MHPLEELLQYLRPPGLGIFTISSGKELQNNNSQKSTTEVGEILNGTEAVVLAVPSDCGAGIMRGAAWGPWGIRRELGDVKNDLGDVFCVPQFLEDGMLSEEIKNFSRREIYPSIREEIRSSMPVSPLSIMKRVLELIEKISPGKKVFVIGGDHSVTWPAVEVLTRKKDPGFGILHFDAHTDLLPQRLGVEYCFATWAYHAMMRLQNPGQLLQVGIRASAHKADYWRDRFGVQQIWANEANAMKATDLAAKVVSCLRRSGVKRLYISHDIDGTDERWASACGTPEKAGLKPNQIATVLESLEGEFDIVGCDLVELAPFLSLSQKKATVTCKTAARYFRLQMKLLNS